MRASLLALLTIACSGTAADPLQLQSSGTTAEFRGISVAGSTAVWAAGRNGTYARSIDGGRTWTADTVPGAGDLFFIDVHAVDESVAYLLGTHFDGGLAKIFKTTQAGASWEEQFSAKQPGVFFDGMAFWDAESGVAFSDPVDGSFLIIRTEDGGDNWQIVPPSEIPAPLPGEAGFAASGTAIAVYGANLVWFGTGGGRVARVFRSSDRGRTWAVSETPIPGNATSGIFGIAFRDASNGVAVGGDYSRQQDPAANIARSRDGGKTWTLVGRSQPPGVRYGLAYLGTPAAVLLAVGPSGLGYSLDHGTRWTAIDTLGFNTVGAGGDGSAWVAGVGGRIARFERPAR